MAPTRPTAADKAAEPDTETKAAAPVQAGRSQPGEAVTAPLTNRPPRGVGEPPADVLADEPAARALQEAVNEVIHKETEQGFRGYNTDPTPNEAYTLRGVGKGMPTPETTVVTPNAAQ